MKQIASLIIIFFFGIEIAQAQTALPSDGKIKVWQPQLLLKNIIKASETESLLKDPDWGQKSPTDRFWNVYSDRSHNITYKHPSENNDDKCDELSFGEAVRIAQIKNGFALVYTEEMKGTNPPVISTQARSRGWIPMKHLLLWDSCPADQYGIYKKAVIVINLDGVEKGTEDLGVRFENPMTKDNAKKLVADMNFYFVMKHEGDYVLLAKECKMNGYSLYGWVKNGSYVPWSQRTCIEPNWDPKVAENLKNVRVPVFKDGVKATDILMGRINGITKSPATKYRLEPQLMRYPLLEVGKQYKVTAFARPNGEGHVPTVPTGSDEVAVQLQDRALKSSNTINIIVVIDGTRSMENFYKPIQEAIKSAYETFGNDNKVKVGVVIYRDYEDGKYITEKLSMRDATDPSVSRFLSTGGDYGIKSNTNDRTNTEALYQGLAVALDAKGMGYQKDNSNLLIVVGDCGNHEKDTKCLSQEEIIEKCAQNRIHLIAFQVRNENEKAFLLFRKQMGDILRGNLRKQNAFNTEGTDYWAKIEELDDGYEYATNRPANETLFIGAMRNAGLHKEMEVQKLNELIKNCYIGFSHTKESVEKLIANAADIIRETEGAAGSSTSTMELKVLERIFTKEEIQKFKDNNSLFAFNGYTDIKAENDQEYWKPIIYIESDEFKQLMEKLAPVYRAAGEKEGNRKPYVQAMQALLRSMNPEITEAEMDNMDVTTIMNMVSGLNVKTKSLEYRLIDIQDRNIVNDSVYGGLITQFIDRYNKLLSFLSNGYDFSVERGKTKWYWIPVQDLP